MKKNISFFLTILFIHFTASAQEILPGISVKNIAGNIIVSWRNEYQKPITVLNIQRSYDSLHNYTTIGSVINPQNPENGFTDAAAPYNKMYYRVFIGFEGGAYLLSKPVRPSKDTAYSHPSTVRYTWQTDPLADPNLQVPVTVSPPPAPETPQTPQAWVASKMIYTIKDNNVVLLLPNAENKNYLVKFYDENEHQLFELTHLKEDFFIVDKVNFKKSGWYHFDIWESGKLIEKNKFFIAKDGKITNDTPRRTGNR